MRSSKAETDAVRRDELIWGVGRGEEGLEAEAEAEESSRALRVGSNG